MPRKKTTRPAPTAERAGEKWRRRTTVDKPDKVEAPPARTAVVATYMGGMDKVRFRGVDLMFEVATSFDLANDDTYSVPWLCSHQCRVEGYDARGRAIEPTPAPAADTTNDKG